MCPQERKARRAAAKAKAAARGKGGRKGRGKGRGKGKGKGKAAGRGWKRKAGAALGDQAEVEEEPSEAPEAAPEAPDAQADVVLAVAPADELHVPVPANNVFFLAPAAGAPVEEQGADAVAAADAAAGAVVEDAPPPVAAPEVEEPASSSSKPRVLAGVRGPNMHATPGILAELSPPTSYKMRLSFNDHRFKVEVMAEAEQRRIGAKSFSRSFASAKALWKDVLAETHRWMWRNWLASPDAGDGPRQEPGHISQAVLDALSPIIDAMPEPKVYK